MFVAIDRTSKFAFVELHEKATTAVSRDFLLRLIAAVPYKIHTVLTDNGIQFTTPGAGGSAVPLIKEGERFRAHAFEYACATNDIELSEREWLFETQKLAGSDLPGADYTVVAT